MSVSPSPLIQVRGRAVRIDGAPLTGTHRFSVGIWEVEVSPPVDFAKGNPGACVMITGRGTFYLKRKGTHDYRICEDGQIEKVKPG